MTREWLAVRPQPFKHRKPLPELAAKPLSEEERRSGMRWRIDPSSPAADALRALRKKLVK
jgi:hypothetical protein